MSLNWKSSYPLTVGIEWELQILDRETLQPKDLFEEIYNYLSEDVETLVHKEVYQSMLEVVTPPSEDEKEAIKTLKKVFSEISPLGVEKNFHLVGLGTLYSEPLKGTAINSSPRYERFAKEFGEILRDFYIYGIHIHIGVPDEDWALRAYNNLVKFAPLLLALSSSSLYYRGKNTDIHSYRMVIFEKLPRAELPQFFSSYGELIECIDTLKKNGVIETVKDLWWHIRPRPDLGTLEVRVFDSIWDLNRLEFLVKLVRSIVLYSQKYQDNFLPETLKRQNWWWAKRYSLDTDFVDEAGRKALKQVAYDLFYKMDHLGVLQKLGYRVDELVSFLRKPSPSKDISLKAKALGLEEVIRRAAVV